MMASRALVVIAALVALAACAAAWGNTGHQAVAGIAQNLLTKDAAARVAQILGSESMVDASTWADSIKHTAAYTWSAPLHYVDAQDKMCNFDYDRDCWDHEMSKESSMGACVAGAITNYTQRATGRLREMRGRLEQRRAQRVNGNKPAHPRHDDSKLSDDAVNEAVKFIIHFVGDIHQPLHVAFAGDRGGNEITVKFFGYKENLHAIWDEYIISRLLSDFYGGSQARWVSDLTTQVKTGNFSRDAPQWAACNDGTEACTTIFANESIAFACSTAYECVQGSDTPCDTQKVIDGSELAEPYFESTYPVVNLRIAQGGVRLAALFNHIFG